ncbi:MAG: hypothetical protein ABI459_10025 [Deltaproteobacteria bacterium]
MRRFYLHVGGHKTGSSAQQVWFANNADALKAAGLVYPSDITGSHGNCLRIAEAWTLDPDVWDIQNTYNMTALAALIDENPADDVLLSAELLAEDATVQQLPRIAADLGEYDFDVRAIMFVRNQVDQLSSLYAQRAKLLQTKLRFDRAVREASDMQQSDWHQYYTHHTALGWTPVIGAFGRKKDQSVVESFFDLAGLRERFPAGTDFNVDEINPSLGEIGVLVALHVARHFAARKFQMAHNGNVYFSRCLISACQDIEDRRFIGPDAEDRAYIRARFGPEITVIVD